MALRLAGRSGATRASPKKHSMEVEEGSHKKALLHYSLDRACGAPDGQGPIRLDCWAFKGFGLIPFRKSPKIACILLGGQEDAASSGTQVGPIGGRGHPTIPGGHPANSTPK